MFRVGFTRDFLKPDGSLGFGDIGLELLDGAEGVTSGFLEEDVDELRGEDIREYDALVVLRPRITPATLEGNERLMLIARFGVGYDSVDVEACTRSGVMLTITPDGVRRPVATSAMAMLLASSHRLIVKDRMTREGRWAEKIGHMGQGLTGRTLGVIGLGNIGQEVLRLAAAFEMRHLGYDPHVSEEALAGLTVDRVPLEQLLRQSDFVVICCALVPETRHLINRERLGSMKPTAHLINVARGPVIDQQALTDALQERVIRGAALDVFEQEPIDPKDPLLELDNVIVAPHAICWTDELFLGVGRSAGQSVLDVAAGRIPKHIVNLEVLEHPRLHGHLSPGEE